MRTYFHCHSADADPAELLDPDRHCTEPWGHPEHGPCDKCGATGTAVHECCSCLEDGADPACPSCEGRVRFVERCPTCEGTGEISRTRRHGVAVFPRRAGLYRYLANRDADVEGKVVVELEARLSEERDLDAYAGALLAYPERIVSVEALDPDRVAAIREREASAAG